MIAWECLTVVYGVGDCVSGNEKLLAQELTRVLTDAAQCWQAAHPVTAARGQPEWYMQMAVQVRPTRGDSISPRRLRSHANRGGFCTLQQAKGWQCTQSQKFRVPGTSIL